MGKHTVRSSTEVCGNTDALEDRRGSKEGLDIGVTEVVLALCGGSHASGLECASQEGNVSLFILGDGLDAVICLLVEASGLEVGHGVLGQSLAVEGILEVFQRERIVENVTV